MTILRSLIHRLVTKRRQLVKYVKAAYEMYGVNFDQNHAGLWRMLPAIASDKHVGLVTIVVDAIDECEETTKGRFLQDVVNLIETSRTKPRENCALSSSSQADLYWDVSTLPGLFKLILPRTTSNKITGWLLGQRLKTSPNELDVS